jgi:uncharacterized protein (TIGR01732 family)
MPEVQHGPRGNNSFAFILVLFILLAIISCVCKPDYGYAPVYQGYGCGC